jgi:hypothetical protein
MEKNYEKYKLVDSVTGDRVDNVEYLLSKKDVETINYAYNTNGVSKKMVALE